MSRRRLPTLLLTLLLTGCLEPQQVPDVSGSLSTIGLADARSVPLDAVGPTDLVPLGGDRALVVDGHAGRAWLIDLAGDAAPVALGGGPVWGHPVRATPRAAGGFWLADPGGVERAPVLLAVDAEGKPVGAVEPAWADDTEQEALAPTAVLEIDGALVVGDRWGRVAWVDPETGQITKLLGADGEQLGTLTDLVPAGDGSLLAVGATAHLVYRIAEDAQPLFGRFGEWAGTLRQPKSIALAGEDAVFVADSALGVVQLFDLDGRFLAVLGDGGEAMHWEHPLAVRALGRDRYAVLDAATATVTSFRIDPAAIEEARSRASRRVLRGRMVPDEGLAGERLCRQCHDGFVNDSRLVWDPRAVHHPVGVVPERELPPFFPLSEAGEIVCSTCHSPHGVVDEEAALGVGEDDDRVALVRHGSEGRGFTRLAVEDSALCTACHEDSAHASALSRLDLGGGSHPVGDKLEQAMAKRPGTASDAQTDAFGGGCLGCHAAHGGASQPMLRAADDGVLCVTCHEGQASATRSHPLGASPGKDMPTPRRSAALLTARDGGVLCRTCHDAVGGRGRALLREAEDGGILCLVCHDERKAVPSSPHGRVRGPSGLPCLGCHDVHGLAAEDHFLRNAGQGTDEDPLGCLSCHGPEGSAATAGVSPGLRGHPLVDEAGGLAQSDPPLQGCPTCHDAHTASTGNSDSCVECHAEQGDADARGGHGKADCLDCHPAHSEGPEPVVLSRDISRQSRRCLACHSQSSRQPAEVPRVEDYEHPEPVFLPGGGRWKPLATLPLFGGDGEQLAPGDNGELACGSCHRTHGPDPEHPVRDLRRPGWERSCSACHGDQALSLYLYFHDSDRRSEEGAP